MRVKLRVLEGSEKSLEIPLKGPKFFVGRDKTCHLRPRSDLISRHHCVILLEPESVVVRDFGSKNGTLVNGERVVDRQKLAPGDELTIGPLKFEVVIEMPAPTRSSNDDSIHSDADIDSWLQEDPPEPSLSDTRSVSAQDVGLADTAEIDKRSLEREKNKQNRTDDPEPKALPGRNAKSSETQDAAADMLRQLSQQMRDKREG